MIASLVHACGWLQINGLSLNASKSEAMAIGTGARHRQEIGEIQLGDASIETTTHPHGISGVSDIGQHDAV